MAVKKSQDLNNSQLRVVPIALIGHLPLMLTWILQRMRVTGSLQANPAGETTAVTMMIARVTRIDDDEGTTTTTIARMDIPPSIQRAIGNTITDLGPQSHLTENQAPAFPLPWHLLTSLQASFHQSTKRRIFALPISQQIVRVGDRTPDPFLRLLHCLILEEEIR